jgi:hypothetical protein
VREVDKRRWRLALLAFVVLAVHLWFLAGMPRFTIPEKNAATWTARTVTPPAPPPAPAAPAVEAPAKKPQAAVVPITPPAPRKQEVTPEPQRRPATATAPASAASAPEHAAHAAREPASSTRQSGSSPALRFSVPGSAHFNYDVVAHTKGISLSGNARLDWRNDGREYEAQLTLSAPFLRSRTQRSTGLVTAQGLAPLRFSDKYRSEEAAHFDRENGKVVFSTNKPEALLEPGVQDRLSIVLQLGAMLAGDPSRYPAGSHITVQTASTKEAEPWTFTVDAPETLALPGGRVQAVRLTRAPRKEYDVKVELWLAPGAAYAPVRLRLTQPNGDWVDQQWSSTDRG